ncbi:DciA family protein [Undibacterium sp. SXout11W]|uniref:DciA family protein n=1 Tax=Undibacterium sp. SXout11W TaxID=3413050 RepID=UPI003BF42BB1
MSASSIPPHRLHIKRGRPVSVTSGASDFLRANDKIAALLPAIQRNLALQRDCEAVLSSLFELCEVMQLADGQLVLAASNAAIATKLKQQCPKLQLKLQERGWQINAIRIKVQVKRVIEKPLPVKQLAIPETAIQALSNLEKNIEKTAQNADLRAALTRLLSRHRQSGDEK